MQAKTTFALSTLLFSGYRTTLTSKTNTIESLFSATDAIEEQLVSLIHNETQKIQIAVFRLSNKQITQALLEQQKKGISIEVITDSGGLDTRIASILKLHTAGIPIYIFPTDSSNQGLMHHKFCLFHQNGANARALLWTGSYNFSQAASNKNQENVVIIDDRTVFARYEAEFTRLKTNSLRL
jgi:phosphatidylserine/phosphatidylglycerophosphate/cardiolipin synthase-like enzyme